MKCIQINYRPQTKFAKVMFSQVSICPRGEGLGLCPGVSIKGVSVRETPLGRDSPGQRTPRQRPRRKRTPCKVTGLRHASYWNAFLLFLGFEININGSSTKKLTYSEISIPTQWEHFAVTYLHTAGLFFLLSFRNIQNHFG